VEGQAACQLCVSQGRRAKILRLAHESVFVHVQSCCTCSLRSRTVTTDRVPLTRIPRTGEFGRVVTPTPACVSVGVFSTSSSRTRSTISHRSSAEIGYEGSTTSPTSSATVRDRVTPRSIARRRRPTSSIVRGGRTTSRRRSSARARSCSTEVSSDSPRPNPMVCVANEDRGGRIACDYRDLNLIYDLLYSLFVYVAMCLHIMSICMYIMSMYIFCVF